MSVNSKMTAIADAIRAKTGGTDALTLDGMAEAVAGIEAGGSVEVESGTVTLSSDRYGHVFVDYIPDILIVYSENDENPTHSSRNGIWAFVKDNVSSLSWFFGYNNGTGKYYVPFAMSHTASDGNMLVAGEFNGMLIAAASPYRWIAVKGASL